MKKLCRFSGPLFFSVLFLPLVFGQAHGPKGTLPQPKEKQSNGDKKEPEDKDPKKPYWQKMVEQSQSERVSGRQNGVRLRAEVGIRKEKKGDVVLVHWLIDYNGARQPLIILKPTLEPVGYQQCMVVFSLVNDEGYIEQASVFFDGEGIDPVLLLVTVSFWGKDVFLTIKKGEVGKGTIEIPLQQIESRVRKVLPGKFAKFPPERMFAQIRFIPNIRVTNLNLDPWTGDVQTEFVPVPLGKFAKD